MTPTLLRFSELRVRGIVRNWVTLKRWQEDPNVRFPRGQMTGPRTRTWTEEEINEWLASRPVTLDAVAVDGALKAQEAEAAELEAAPVV
jgi:predicted DNA-binding transcriptional regulator AlpA